MLIYGNLMQNKQFHPRSLISSICHRHHFSNPNTVEIVLSLLFLGVISRLLTFMSREAKY
jgi:hypothetical protein